MAPPPGPRKKEPETKIVTGGTEVTHQTLLFSPPLWSLDNAVIQNHTQNNAVILVLRKSFSVGWMRSLFSIIFRIIQLIRIMKLL